MSKNKKNTKTIDKNNEDMVGKQNDKVTEEQSKEDNKSSEEEVKVKNEKKEDQKEDSVSLQEKIKNLENEIENLTSARIRLVAEFDNYKRRTAKETVNIISTANQELISELIPVLENFERALHPDHKNSDEESFYKGVEMIYKQFYDVLKKVGLKEDNPVGKEFNSEYHEAMMQIDSKDVPENHIAQVVQKGYELNGKVIRYAKVVVSKGNTEEEDKKNK